MWQKIKDQLPTVILTVIIVVASAFWIHQQTVSQVAARQQAELAPLREQNDALKVASEENRHQIEVTNQLLKDAIAKREADMFRTDQEIQQLNTERMDALAEAIAKKVQPYNPLPKTPEEAERMRQNFCDISPLAPQALARAYLLRGWWLRRHRFLRWYGMRPKP